MVVQVTDENDCTPEFLHAIYSKDGVPENVSAGTSLLQGGAPPAGRAAAGAAVLTCGCLPVVARDCDSGLNARLSYFVQSADFDITSEGVVHPAKRLDYERPNHVYEFVVVAVDAGMPPRTGTASVRIRVANSNDEAPVFSQNVYVCTYSHPPLIFITMNSVLFPGFTSAH